MPSFELTAEQDAVLAIRKGFRVVCANAGTGKTFSLSELLIKLYLEEEARLYPDAKEHVSGEPQRYILRQFLVVTFTVAAAAELNNRILMRFAELGIPQPAVDRRGNPYRICRTLDSFIQSWMAKPRVFEAWMAEDLDAQRSIERTLSRLPSEAVAVLSEEPRFSPRYALYRKWCWLAGDTVDSIILELILRDEIGAEGIEGISPLSEWPLEWEEFLRTFKPPTNPDERWGEAFWKPKVEAYQAYCLKMRQLHTQWREGKLADHPNGEEIIGKITMLECIWTTRREFLSCYEIARAKGYHPIRAFDNLAKMSILNEVAASTRIHDFRHLHNIGLAFYSVKVQHHLMDHGDFLNTFVDLLEKYSELTEPQAVYPKFGIRAKHVLWDETQDNNPYQSKIIYLLSPKKFIPHLIVVVGDSAQAIYGFRGACSFGFANMIDRAKRRHPGDVLSLSCSFRSAIAIVDLGNLIAKTLPRYGKKLHGSTTIYKEPGRIVVAPPMKTPSDEAAWTLEQASEILRTTAKDTVMVLHRNNFTEHPIVPGLDELMRQFPKRISYLTIHRSKGLEADNVFVLGLTATVIPDPRGNETQEANLFYVACTRPRKTLFLCCPYHKKRVDKEGQTTWESVGPSPFITRVSILDEIADKAGWPIQLRSLGEKTHRAAVGFFVQQSREKAATLKVQWREMFPDIPLAIEQDESPNDENGNEAVPEEILKLQRKSLFDEHGKVVEQAAFAVDEHLRNRLQKRLLESLLKSGDVPRLTRQEYGVAMAAGWIARAADSTQTKFSSSFAARLKNLAAL